jgi:hypothetical protein
MWGLQERAVAATSLEGFAAQLTQCRPAMMALLPAPELPALEAFFSRTVDAAGTLRQEELHSLGSDILSACPLLFW